MSATGRKGGARVADDNYPTPPWAVHRWLESWRADGLNLSGRLLEPMAGEGNIIRALHDHPRPHLRPGAIDPASVSWTAWELRDECAPSLVRLRTGYDLLGSTAIGDIFDPAGSISSLYAIRGYGVFDHAITNPSYSLAWPLLKMLWPIANTITLLLRLNWLEGAEEGEPERAAFLADNQPDVRVLPNRPPFSKSLKTGKVGTDATAYAWMTWGPHSRGSRRGSISRLAATPRAERAAWTAALRGRP